MLTQNAKTKTKQNIVKCKTFLNKWGIPVYLSLRGSPASALISAEIKREDAGQLV